MTQSVLYYIIGNKIKEGNKMRDKNFIEGLNIISKHIPEGEEFNLAAEHDIIYFGEYDWVKGKDRAKLKRLGWIEEEDAWTCYV